MPKTKTSVCGKHFKGWPVFPTWHWCIHCLFLFLSASPTVCEGNSSTQNDALTPTLMGDQEFFSSLNTSGPAKQYGSIVVAQVIVKISAKIMSFQINLASQGFGGLGLEELVEWSHFVFYFFRCFIAIFFFLSISVRLYHWLVTFTLQIPIVCTCTVYVYTNGQ